MQSSHLLSTQMLQQSKITQLNLRLKRQRFIALTFFSLALILSLALLVNCSSKTQQHLNQIEQVSKVSQACTNFQFNNTNLTEFNWRIQYNKSNQDQSLFEQTTKIVILNLSSNLLKTFSDNSLPDLEELNLFQKNKFPDNQYEAISNNKFPKLKNLTIPRVVQFSGNYLPSLTDFEQENIFFFVNKFDNNYMPTLNGSRQFYHTNSITGNTLGISELRFDAENGFKFYNNTFVELKSLQVFCSSQMNQMPSSVITNNLFPNLQRLIVYCNILDFKQLNKFKKLEILYLRSLSIKQFSNNSHSQLKSFVSQTQNLKTFSNNYLPLLEGLRITSRSLINICQGNYMPNLKMVDISSNLKSIDCFKNVQNLQYLSLIYISAPMENFYLPKLKQLHLLMENNQSFLYNSFPSIQTFTINQGANFTSLKVANITLGNSLAMFGIGNSALQELTFDRDMPKLAKIIVTSSNLTSVNCSSFKNIKQLILQSGKLKDQVIDTLIDCNFTNPRDIYLKDNLILDKAKARAKLASRYPNTYISL